MKRRNGGSTPQSPWAAAALALLASLVVPALAAAEADGPPRLRLAEVELTGVFEAAPSRDVYTAIARQAELAVTFDPALGDREVSIDLGGMAPRDALLRLASLSGHFLVPVDERTLFVAQDTPRNRRDLEPLGVRTFVLRHAAAPDVMTALRSLLDARRVIVATDPPRITVRDTYPRLAAASRIVEMLDKEPWEVRLRVDLVSTDATTFDEIVAAGGAISAQRAAALRDAPSAALASGVLGLVGGRSAEWKSGGGGAATETADPTSEPSRILSLTARGRLTSGDDRLDLELELAAFSPGAERTESLRQTSSFRVADGSALALPIARGRDATAQLLLLTPEILTRGELDPDAVETFLVGSETTPVADGL